MARINIESTWFTDERRYKLAELLGGNKREADGLIIEAWKMSQEFWGNGRRKIPIFIFKEIKDHELLFEVGLAVEENKVVYVRGTAQHHEWYASLKERSSKGGKSLRKDAKLNQSKREANAEPLILSSLILSSSDSQKNTYLQEIKLAWDVWTKTLKSFNVPESKISPQQESSIARAIKTIGFENVIDALEGAKYEPRTETFDPSKVLRIDRVLHRDSKGVSRWEQFANLARQARQKNEQLALRAVDLKNKALGIEP